MSRRTRFVAFLISFATLTVVFSCPSLAHAQIPSAGFQATYYQGKNFQGKPLLARLEPVVNWTYDAGGTPAPGVVPSTDFSARWESWYYMDRPGAWTFTYTSDDGGRVWLDNELVIDYWYDHGPLTRVKTKELAEGYHLMRVEYYQAVGGMTSQLTLTPPGLFPDWMGEYFDNPYVLGEPRYRINNLDINFNWGSGSPDPRIPSENFSVRWTRLSNFAAGNYAFTATADDGIRVWVGDTLAIDGWVPQQAKTYTQTLYLNGTVPIRVEYFEQGGQAVVNLIFKAGNAPPPAVAGETWRGEFFNNATLTPPATCEQAALQLHFDWGSNSPGCNLAGQLFSARWEATRNTSATGFYSVQLTVDDGARIFVDDKLILDAWREQPPTSYATTVYLNAGAHQWRVEYFQGAGGAQLALEVSVGVAAALSSRFTERIVHAGGAGWTAGGNVESWHRATTPQGQSAFWANNHGFTRADSNLGRWYLPLHAAGTFQVSVHIPADLATTQHARYVIYHNGRFDFVAISQAAYHNAWVPLGAFYFSGQGGEFVALSNVTYEANLSTTIVWDSIRFTPRE